MKKENLILEPFKSARRHIARELYIPKAFKKKVINSEEKVDSPKKNKQKEI